MITCNVSNNQKVWEVYVKELTSAYMTKIHLSTGFDPLETVVSIIRPHYEWEEKYKEHMEMNKIYGKNSHGERKNVSESSQETSQLERKVKRKFIS